MKNIFLFFIYPVLGVAFVEILGQTCQPLTVQNVEIDAYGTLSWTPAANDNCTTSFYVIRVNNVEATEEYAYVVFNTSITFTNLNVCENYRFHIIPVSPESIEGIVRVYFARLPLPPDANLTVGFVAVSDGRETVRLRWEMESRWQSCADRFRVVIYDEDDNTFVDEYTFDQDMNVTNLIPCTRYIFGVMALYSFAEEGPVTTVERTISEYVTYPPTLEAISLGSTTVDLSWKLDNITTNRCTITSLEVSSSVFNISQHIKDEPERPSVSVRVINLQASSIYVLNVSVINVAGQSRPTIIAIQTLN